MSREYRCPKCHQRADLSVIVDIGGGTQHQFFCNFPRCIAGQFMIWKHYEFTATSKLRDELASARREIAKLKKEIARHRADEATSLETLEKLVSDKKRKLGGDAWAGLPGFGFRVVHVDEKPSEERSKPEPTSPVLFGGEAVPPGPAPVQGFGFDDQNSNM